MAFTDIETARILAIETVLNELQESISNLMSKMQMRQLLLLKQQEIQALTSRVEALESQVQILQTKLR